MLGGCAADPVVRSERLAAEAGAARTVFTGNPFRHVVFSRGVSPAADHLHVYIGGDGRPFENRYRVAREPTPRHPLTLELMLADDAPAAYIGRPCYHGVQDQGEQTRCHPGLWTTGRFAEPVVASLADALGQLADRVPRARITLIGYSGGGVLAVLVAARSPRVDTVVTLAAPLDTAAWTRAHGYTPLHGSINPADVNGWPPALRQVHVHGADDRNVAPAQIEQFRARTGSAGMPVSFRVVDGFDHVCCWRERWPGMLHALLAAEPDGSREKRQPTG